VSEKLYLSDFEIQILIIERNTCQYRIEQVDELLNKIGKAQQAPATLGAKSESATVQELTFTTLKFEPQKGSLLGDFDVAFKANNIADKFIQAYNILNKSNATIQNRYHGQGYQFNYWLFGTDKIYRQKHKI